MSNANSESPDETARSIPSEIKRKVRQECGFGCAICGSPVFHYDHIEEFSVVRAHDAKNIVLLCEQHHAAKTTGKLSKNRVKEAKVNPFNSNRNNTGSYKIESAREIAISIGGNRASTRFDGDGHYVILSISRRFAFVLRCIDSWMTISFVITDAMGQPMLIVKEGELSVSTMVWDYEYVGNRLKIRTELGQVYADIVLSDTEVAINRGHVVVGRLHCAIQENMMVVYCDDDVRAILANCSSSLNEIGAFEFYDQQVTTAIGGFGWSQGIP